MKYYLSINQTKTVELHEYASNRFQICKRYQKHYIIYADFESISKPATHNKNNVQTLKNIKMC